MAAALRGKCVVEALAPVKDVHCCPGSLIKGCFEDFLESMCLDVPQLLTDRLVNIRWSSSSRRGQDMQDGEG